MTRARPTFPMATATGSAAWDRCPTSMSRGANTVAVRPIRARERKPPSGNPMKTLLLFRIRSFGVHFFFFQAEDGIRDHCVTGVQTCALPISTVEGNDLTAEQQAAKLRLVV